MSSTLRSRGGTARDAAVAPPRVLLHEAPPVLDLPAQRPRLARFARPSPRLLAARVSNRLRLASSPRMREPPATTIAHAPLSIYDTVAGSTAKIVSLEPHSLVVRHAATLSAPPQRTICTAVPAPFSRLLRTPCQPGGIVRARKSEDSLGVGRREIDAPSAHALAEIFVPESGVERERSAKILDVGHVGDEEFFSARDRTTSRSVGFCIECDTRRAASRDGSPGRASTSSRRARPPCPERSASRTPGAFPRRP